MVFCKWKLSFFDCCCFSPVTIEGPPLSAAAFSSTVGSALGEEGLICLTGDEDVDLAGEELSDRPSLDSDLDLDLFNPAEADLDFDLLPLFLGDLDLVLPGGGE